MIKLNNIRKVYEDKYNTTEALRGINLEVSKGELVAIIGKSGSGKTTLLNIIGGMDRATSGEYIFGNINVSQLRGRQLDRFRKENISFIFQNFALMSEYSVYENIELPLIAKKINRKQRKRIIKEVLQHLEIEELEKKYPTQISGGQQQRCAIARALASGNELILADEPTGSLDRNTSYKIVDQLRELNKTGKTVIIITHDLDIANMCNRIISIDDGYIKNI